MAKGSFLYKNNPVSIENKLIVFISRNSFDSMTSSKSGQVSKLPAPVSTLILKQGLLYLIKPSTVQIKFSLSILGVF